MVLFFFPFLESSLDSYSELCPQNKQDKLERKGRGYGNDVLEEIFQTLTLFI